MLWMKNIGLWSGIILSSNVCFVVLRLGSTCNHVLALLFKVDYAWQNGLTSGCMKPCTATANVWMPPKLTTVKPIQIADMAIVKPNFRSSATRKVASAKDASTARQLFRTERSR